MAKNGRTSIRVIVLTLAVITLVVACGNIMVINKQSKTMSVAHASEPDQTDAYLIDDHDVLLELANFARKNPRQLSNREAMMILAVIYERTKYVSNDMKEKVSCILSGGCDVDDQYLADASELYGVISETMKSIDSAEIPLAYYSSEANPERLPEELVSLIAAHIQTPGGN